MWDLAQQTGSQRNLGPVLFQLGLLVVLVVLAGVIVLLLRKRLLGGHEEASGIGGSIFADLQRLRDDGEISTIEYDYLRKVIASRAAGREPPPRPPELEAEELRARPGFDLSGEPLPPDVLRAQAEEGKGVE
ncbi:MAG: hypothetical protein D6695_04265 [Planctomycetota bacterium]|nr:MAG: hypothetical protein D6695_04265 [Planctomycetota bacterium]